MKSESKSRSSLAMADNVPSPFLYSRQQVAHLLGDVDVSFVRRLEKAGRLKAVRLTRSPSAMAFYTAENVAALVADVAK